jgi:flagellar M-ring protein FliF
MPEVLSRIQHKFTDFWKDLDKSQKIRIYIISGILLAAIIAGIFLITKTTYVPLITSTDSTELAEMKTVLSDANLKYKSEGNTILIDQKNNDKAQGLLVQKGYPKSPDAIFADALDKMKLSDTESDKNKRIIDATSRTIAAKLRTLDCIQDASVTLVIPEPSVFLLNDNPSKTTASVMIKPKYELNKEQIDAVIMLVARSVENLKPEDITLVDYDLHQLNTEQGEDTVGASSQSEITSKIKTDLEKNIMNQFNGQFADFEGMAVSVVPYIDFDQQDTESKVYSNPSGTSDLSPSSSQTEQTDIVNGDGTGAVPGMGTNPGTTPPSYQIQTNGSSPATYNQKKNTSNFIYNEVVTKGVKKTIAVSKDKTFVAVSLKYGDRVKDITPQAIAAIKEQVAAAAGGIPASNVTVNKFAIVPQAAPKVSAYDQFKSVFNDYGTFALILLLAIGLLIAALPRKKRVQPVLQAATPGGPKFAVPEPYDEYLPEIDLEERSEVKKQIDKFVKQKPEAVAQLLRNWLSDDWDN